MTVRSPLVLLPPSEGKATGGAGPCWRVGSMQLELDAARDRVLRALTSAMRANAAARAKLLGVKGEALAAATVTNRAVRTTPTMPAMERYTGVLYDALDITTLDATSRTRLDQNVLILSGLWGAVAPNDPIPDYKLKMGASLGALGRLATWWRRHLDGALAERIAGASSVWNLLPGEHDAAWTTPAGVEVVTVRFLDRRDDGSLAAVSHWNKLLKGALVREIVGTPDLAPEDLADWQHPLGYRLDPSLTMIDGTHTSLSLVRVDG